MALGIYGAHGYPWHGELLECHSGASGHRGQSVATPVPKAPKARVPQHMSRLKPESLLTLTQSFFHSYLQRTRGASPHTVRAYRDALKLFFLFLAKQKRKTVRSEEHTSELQSQSNL